MTQTTSERIEAMLGVHYDWTGRVIEAGVDTAARKIAAEIDALTRERDEAREQVAGLDAGMRFQFDRAEDYKAQRDEARAEVATLTLKLANARLNLKHCSEEVDKRDECAGQLAEARAEVERLRPAADKWQESLEYWRESGHRAKEAMLEAEESAAALAAKGAQP